MEEFCISIFFFLLLVVLILAFNNLIYEITDVLEKRKYFSIGSFFLFTDVFYR
jgi:hypothetical protein